MIIRLAALVLLAGCSSSLRESRVKLLAPVPLENDSANICFYRNEVIVCFPIKNTEVKPHVEPIRG